MNTNHQDIKNVIIKHYPTNIRSGMDENQHESEIAEFVKKLSHFVKKYIIDEFGNFNFMFEKSNDNKTTFHVHQLLRLLENHDYHPEYDRKWEPENPSDQLRIFWTLMSFHMLEQSKIKLKLQKLLHEDSTYG